MKIQVLVMACDPISIKNTVKTWARADRIVVYANGPEKHIIKEQLSGCKVIIGDFIGFSETRNLLISLAQTDKYDYNIFIDDSYELRGSLDELVHQTLCHGLIRVKTLNDWQNRKIIFKKGQYTGHIHETLTPDLPTFQIQFSYIEDVVYEHHELRRVQRLDYDLEMLDREPKCRRTDYYKAINLVKKVMQTDDIYSKNLQRILTEKC